MRWEGHRHWTSARGGAKKFNQVQQVQQVWQARWGSSAFLSLVETFH